MDSNWDIAVAGCESPTAHPPGHSSRLHLFPLCYSLLPTWYYTTLSQQIPSLQVLFQTFSVSWEKRSGAMEVMGEGEEVGRVRYPPSTSVQCLRLRCGLPDTVSEQVLVWISLQARWYQTWQPPCDNKTSQKLHTVSVPSCWVFTFLFMYKLNKTPCKLHTESSQLAGGFGPRTFLLWGDSRRNRVQRAPHWENVTVFPPFPLIEILQVLCNCPKV